MRKKIDIKKLRELRDILMSQCSVYSEFDVLDKLTEQEKVELSEYKQHLRNLPQLAISEDESVVFSHPTKPSFMLERISDIILRQ